MTAFPEEASRFIRTAQETPQWNDMIQRLERGRTDETLRQWRDWLNKLAHVDRATLGLMWEQTDSDAPLIRLGPIFERKLLEDCVGEAGAVIPPLLEIPEKLCSRYGLQPSHPNAARNYLGRISEWMQQLEKDRQQ